MIWAWNLLLEFGPIILFFVVNELEGFEHAVIAMVLATIVAFLLGVVQRRHVPLFALVSTLGVTVFGGASIFFDNADYYILSDTVFDGALGLVLLLSLKFREPLLKTFFESSFAITDRAWRMLTLRWGLLFLMLAWVNEVVRQTADTQLWVDYKFLTIFIVLGFGCYQFTLSMRERIPEESNWLGLRIR